MIKIRKLKKHYIDVENYAREMLSGIQSISEYLIKKE
jgi:hypothetical protein